MRYKPDIDMRVNDQLTLLLTVFALKFTLADEIPVTHYLNLIDLMFRTGTGVSVLTLFSNIILNEGYLAGHIDKTRRLEVNFDRRTPIITFVAIAISSYFIFCD